MATLKTQPVAVKKTETPAPGVAKPGVSSTGFTAAQFALIDSALKSSLGGIQAGNTVGGFSTIFQKSLMQDKGNNPNGLAFTNAQIATLGQSYINVAGGGAGFRDQGSSAAPFYSAWDARLHQLFPTIAPAPTVTPTPHAANSPIVVPTITPATKPPPAAAVTAPQAATNAVTTTKSITDALAKVVPAPAKVTPAPPTVIPAPPTVIHATGLIPSPGGVATTTAAADTSNAAAAQAAIAAAGNATVPGSGSVGGGIGVADTGTTGLTQTPTTSSGPDMTLILIVVALVGVGGYFVWRSQQHHRAPHPAVAQ